MFCAGSGSFLRRSSMWGLMPNAVDNYALLWNIFIVLIPMLILCILRGSGLMIVGVIQ